MTAPFPFTPSGNVSANAGRSPYSEITEVGCLGCLLGVLAPVHVISYYFLSKSQGIGLSKDWNPMFERVLHIQYLSPVCAAESDVRLFNFFSFFFLLFFFFCNPVYCSLSPVQPCANVLGILVIP